MRSVINAAALALAASLVSAAPATIPAVNIQHLADGFPAPSPQQLVGIQHIAHGQLSNGAPPPKLSDDTKTSLQLVAFNENFEVSYFRTFLKELDNPHFIRNIGELRISLEELKVEIKRIIRVEELHSINANNALKKVLKADPILPCEYIFPVTDVVAAVKLATRFTLFVVGVLEDVTFQGASNGDAGFVPGVVAAAADEAGQTGGFNAYLGLAPQTQPFYTRSERNLAFSLLQDFVKPGSCPNADQIDLEVFQPLSANDPPAHDVDIEFTFSLKQTRADPHVKRGHASPSYAKVANFKSQYGSDNKWKSLSITYFTGQSIVTEPVKSFRIHGDTVTVKAAFPQKEFDIFGVAIATLTVGNGFASAAAVKDATLYGPVPLIVQEAKL